MDSGKDSGLKDRRERRDEIVVRSPTVSESWSTMTGHGLQKALTRVKVVFCALVE
jgi:hypothetical protein